MIGNDVSKAADFLNADEIVGIPTETVYGLAGNALSNSAVSKIFEVKNRPSFDPLIVHTHSLEGAKRLVSEFPAWAERLASKFWPGPLTLLLPKRASISDLVTSGSEMVGIRVPQHPRTLSLLRMLSFPLAAPSANPFGYISPTTAQHVEDQLGPRIAYVLEGGPCLVGLESTIVGIKEGIPTVFRVGGITMEDLQKTLGHFLSHQPSSSQPAAPGMLESHYAPTKPLYLGDIPELAFTHSAKKIGILSFWNDYSKLSTYSISLSTTKNLNEAAGKLFAALRTFDHMDIDLIITEIFPEEGLGRAINDRLSRASLKRI